jgi:hypothetical protein
MGIGNLVGIFSEPLIRRIIHAQPRDAEGRVRPEATALIMGAGSVFTSISQLIFSWTCVPATIHWAVPIAFGIPFGFGNTLTFIYSAHYMAGAYGIYAASAMAGNALIRSVFGGTLPLAGPKMYEVLTPQWAGTLLGLLEVIMIPIPFVLWRYGEKIRGKSRVIRQLRDEQDKLDARKARYEAKKEAKEAAAASQAKPDNEEGVRVVEEDVRVTGKAE